MDSYLMFLNCPAYMDKNGAARCGRGRRQWPSRGGRWLGRLRRVPDDPFPALRRGESAGQNAVDIPDRLRRQRLAGVRYASRAVAVVVTRPRSPASGPLRVGLARHDGRTSLPEEDEPFIGEHGQGVLQGRRPNALQDAHLADRRERFTGGEHPRPDRGPDRVRYLPPGRSAARGVDGKHRHVLVLGERLAGTRQVAAPLQLRVKQV